MRLIASFCLIVGTMVPLFAQDASKAHLDEARKARARKDHARAEREASTAVAEAEKLGGGGDALASALGKLAGIYFERRKFAEAESAAARAIRTAGAAGVEAGTVAGYLEIAGKSAYGQG